MNPLKVSPLTKQFVSRDLLWFKCWAKPTTAHACTIWVLTPSGSTLGIFRIVLLRVEDNWKPHKLASRAEAKLTALSQI